jgi:hypothetical protein
VPGFSPKKLVLRFWEIVDVDIIRGKLGNSAAQEFYMEYQPQSCEKPPGRNREMDDVIGSAVQT